MQSSLNLVLGAKPQFYESPQGLSDLEINVSETSATTTAIVTFGFIRLSQLKAIGNLHFHGSIASAVRVLT